MKKLFRFLLVALIVVVQVLFVVAPVIAADEVFVLWDGTSTSGVSTHGVYFNSQSFLTSGAFYAKSVDLRVCKQTNVTFPGNDHVDLYLSDVNDKPTGSVLASSVMSANRYPYGVANSTWVNYPLASPVVLSANTKYVLVHSYADSAGQELSVQTDGVAPMYDYGKIGWSSNSGSTWTAYTTPDMNFRVYGVTSLDAVVYTTDATDVGASSVTMNGIVASLGSFSSGNVSFQYGTTTGYGGVTTEAEVTGPTSVEGWLDNLVNNTTYHFRLKLVYGGGTAYGLDKSFTTLTNLGSDYPPLLVETNAAESITNTAALLAGHLITLGNDTSVSLRFEYGNTTDYGSTIEPYPNSTSVNNYWFGKMLYGLTANTTYHYRAIATGIIGGTVYGDDVSFTTLTDAESQPLTITTLPATAIGNDTATLNANLTFGGSPSIERVFHYGKSPNTMTGIAVVGITTTPGPFNSTITGLESGTTYYFIAQVNQSPYNGQILSFTTTGTPPATPTDYLGVMTNQGNIVQSSSIIVQYQMQGTLTGTGGSQATVYFQYGPTAAYGSYGLTGTNTLKYSSYANFSDFTGPLSNGVYHYRAVATNGTATVYGQDMSFTISTSGLTPTPTSTGVPVPPPVSIDWGSTASHYLIVIIGMLGSPAFIMFIAGKAQRFLGAVISTLIDAVIFAAAIAVNWVEPTIAGVTIIVCGYIIFRIVKG